MGNQNSLEYSNMAIAAMGVAMKVVIITGMLCMGLGQDIQPLLGYCVGAGLWERFKKVMKFSLVFAFALSLVLTCVCYLFTNQIVSAFLTDKTVFDYAVHFSRILLTTGSLFGIFYVMTNALQAMGAAKEALIINISRQGLIFIPAVFILKFFIGMTGLVWVQPAADIISLLLAIFLYLRALRKMTMKNINKHLDN